MLSITEGKIWALPDLPNQDAAGSGWLMRNSSCCCYHHLKTTGRCTHAMLSSLSVQGMALPQWIAIGQQEWPNCASEAAMPLDLREKLLQLRVARSQGGLLLARQVHSWEDLQRASSFLRVSRTRGGTGPSGPAPWLTNQTSRNRFQWGVCCTPVPTPEKGLLTHSHPTPQLGKVHMTRFYISLFKRH